MNTFIPGEIYLVREFDFTTKKESRYAKIGLVKSPRVSNERLKEHQTGNPNILRMDNSDIVRTEAVNWVEAMLHRIFAKHRVSGEWFELTLAQREKVIAEALALSEEAKELPKLQRKVDMLSESLDNSKTIQPKTDHVQLAIQLLTANLQIEVLTPVQTQINAIFKRALDAGIDVAGAAKPQKKTYAAKLLKDNLTALKKDYPELYEKFEGTASVLFRRFNFEYKNSEIALGLEFQSEFKSILGLVEQVEKEFDPYIANEANLLVNDLMTLAQRQLIFSDLALRVACGKNFAIEGVCNWPRRFVQKPTFDVKKFVAKHKDLAEKYMKASWTETYVNAVKRKAQ
jgi:hypothetical protein